MLNFSQMRRWAGTVAGLVIVTCCLAPGWWKWLALVPVAVFDIAYAPSLWRARPRPGEIITRELRARLRLD
jgi:hypothetical protein